MLFCPPPPPTHPPFLLLPASLFPLCLTWLHTDITLAAYLPHYHRAPSLHDVCVLFPAIFGAVTTAVRYGLVLCGLAQCGVLLRIMVEFGAVWGGEEVRRHGMFGTQEMRLTTV